jgi:UDP-N-acetyl-2-amino-2-deoxyglucuronate dehydrogenase
MGKIWNFAIVGSGLIADFHARAIKDIPNARLLAICDVVGEKAKALADKYSCKSYTSADQMAADPQIDILTIATPSGAHMEPAIAAAKAGKHAICEKPLEITAARMDAMIAAHKHAGTRLACIFQERFADAMKPLREAIATGRFGKITYAGVYVPWWRKDEYYKNSWHGTWKLDGGGALMNQSIHSIDMLCDMMPPVQSVIAFTGHPGHDIETEDTGVAVLRFANNAMGVIYGSTAAWPGQFSRFEISGTKGTVIYVNDSYSLWQFADEQPQDQNIRKQFSKAEEHGGMSDPAAIAHRHHTRNFAAFIDAIEKKTPFILDASVGRRAVDLVLAIYKAAKEQKPVVP